MNAAEYADRNKPDKHDRSECFSYHRGTELLEEEENEQDTDGDWRCWDLGIINSKTFDSRRDTERRCYESVGDDRAATDNGRIDDPTCFEFSYEGIQRKDPAFTFVIGIQSEVHVFDRGDDHHRPEHARHTTKDEIGRDDGVLSNDRAEHVQRRC